MAHDAKRTRYGSHQAMDDLTQEIADAFAHDEKRAQADDRAAAVERLSDAVRCLKIDIATDKAGPLAALADALDALRVAVVAKKGELEAKMNEAKMKEVGLRRVEAPHAAAHDGRPRLAGSRPRRSRRAPCARIALSPRRRSPRRSRRRATPMAAASSGGR